MKLIRYILPHLLIAMALGLVVIAILDGYNPTMAFLTSKTSKAYLYILSALAVLVSIGYIGKDK